MAALHSHWPERWLESGPRARPATETRPSVAFLCLSDRRRVWRPTGHFLPIPRLFSILRCTMDFPSQLSHVPYLSPTSGGRTSSISRVCSCDLKNRAPLQLLTSLQSMYRPGRAQPPRRPLLLSSFPRRTQPPRAGTSTCSGAMVAPINKIARLPSNNSPPDKLSFCSFLSCLILLFTTYMHPGKWGILSRLPMYWIHSLKDIWRKM